jgi:RND family efflux transporter MFP subunit
MHRRRRAASFAAQLVLASLLLAGCKRQNAYHPPPPPEVGVASPVARPIMPYIYSTGTTAAFNSVAMLARVEGFVFSIDYRDGTEVKTGTTLFTIEPTPFRAKLEQAQANLAAAQAQLAQAEAEFKRQASLARTNVASQSTLDQARALFQSDQANVSNQRAGVTLAAINLGYTSVVAPFDGVVTAHLVSVGDLVGVSGPTTLATIVQLAPIYVNFSLPEQEVQRIRAALRKQGLTAADLGKIPADFELGSETGYPHHGVLDYAAPLVDSATGTLAVRAVVENKDRALLPGYYVRVRVPQSREARPALLVPDAALGTAQSGPYLLVVDKDDVVEQRNVTPGQSAGVLRVISQGLRPEDRVIIAGLARAIPGQKVQPKASTMPVD